MKEIRYATRIVCGAGGASFQLSYFITAEDRNSREHYGIRITERNSGDLAQALDLTTNRSRIFALADKLARNAVTPSGLADIVADWL